MRDQVHESRSKRVEWSRYLVRALQRSGRNLSGQPSAPLRSRPPLCLHSLSAARFAPRSRSRCLWCGSLIASTARISAVGDRIGTILGVGGDDALISADSKVCSPSLARMM